jgi:uncharacterized membrane protein YgaE (UPF0421/DUF939 family)
VLGAAVGGLAASYFGSQIVVFGAGIFLLGLLCAITRSEYSAYRFGGVALAIVTLTPRSAPPWVVAFHRFAEVSIGIGIALLFTLIWPEQDAVAAKVHRHRARASADSR